MGRLRCHLGRFQLHCHPQGRLRAAAGELKPRVEVPEAEPLEMVALQGAREEAQYVSAHRTRAPGVHPADTQELEYAGVAVERSGRAPR